MKEVIMLGGGLLIGLMLTSAMRPATPVVAPPAGAAPHGSNYWDVLVTGFASAASILGAYYSHSGSGATAGTSSGTSSGTGGILPVWL
jgi:hypothetical protein